MKRSFLVLGLSVFAVFGSGVAGFPGSGGLCTLVLAFLAGLGWGTEKVKTCACIYLCGLRPQENLCTLAGLFRWWHRCSKITVVLSLVSMT